MSAAVGQSGTARMICPGTRSVQVHGPGREVYLLTESATLEGEDVLPGFSLPVRDLFA